MGTDNSLFDVIVAGAGPVGLFLACELRLGGCSVLVLEKAPDPRSPFKDLPFGLRGLSVPTIESLDRRDLLDDLRDRVASRDTQSAAHWIQHQRRSGGHFAGIQLFLDRIDETAWHYRLPGSIGSLAADMASIEEAFAARAEALGVVIRRGCAIEAIEPFRDGVTTRAGGQIFRSSWLVGCDGGRSTVRKAASIGFAGTDPEFTGYSVQVELANPGILKAGRHYTPTGVYTYSPPGTIAMVDFDGGAFHRTEPTQEQVEAVLRRITGADVKLVALRLATTWSDRAFQAAEYRRGHVLLAGDAAHIHSPLGGQGLNLGLGDAMNLGWKLAATIRGDAPDGLLESYARERHPVGAQILDWSRAQVVLMRPHRSSRALEAIVRDLIETRDGATYFARRVWGVDLAYDMGEGHELLGRSIPDFRLLDGSSVNRQLRTGHGLLLDFGRNPSLRAVAGRWGDRISYAIGDGEHRLGLSAALVRPDGVVAWACEGSPDLEDVGRAAGRWFGMPRDAE
ncbi:MAG: FAD-dependent monooxygenase [Sphingobium sp.]|nr:FAD-dependent monooxygenase [Sphingobium sp.]